MSTSPCVQQGANPRLAHSRGALDGRLEPLMDATESGHAARVSAYAAVGARLSLVSDRRLEDAVGAAPGLGSGIGGRSAEMQVEGVRVFVKRVPLTDVELRPKHARSTANLFGLPLFYQYGVGSAGFGAWRELAAHIMTTGWVLGDAYAGFPLLSPLAGPAGHSPHRIRRRVRGCRRGRGALGRVAGGAPAAGSHWTVNLQPGALPGACAPDARRVARRGPGRGPAGAGRPVALSLGRGRAAPGDGVHERPRTGPLRRALRQPAHRRPASVLRRLRPGVEPRLRTLGGRGRLPHRPPRVRPLLRAGPPASPPPSRRCARRRRARNLPARMGRGPSARRRSRRTSARSSTVTLGTRSSWTTSTIA